MVVKLIDFGLARRIPVSDNSTAVSFTTMERVEAGLQDEGLGPDGLMTTPVGTAHFVAPEVLSNLPYGKEVDLFACGVIMYWLLSGVLPFDDVNPTRLADKIKAAEYDFSHSSWNKISLPAKDLVSRLLERSPFARITATDALSHPWFDQAPRTQEIVVKHWTADPEFDRGTSVERTYRSNQLDNGVSPASKRLASRKSSSTPTLMSPVTPDGNSTSMPFRVSSRTSKSFKH